jgi:hypothetical protein
VASPNRRVLQVLEPLMWLSPACRDRNKQHMVQVILICGLDCQVTSDASPHPRAGIQWEVFSRLWRHSYPLYYLQLHDLHFCGMTGPLSK